MSIGLIVSILIRLVAFIWSLLLLRRSGDWRMGFLSIMLALMTLRQILTLKANYVSPSLSFSKLGTEWPGLIVSIMAFLAVFFLGKIIEERKRVAAEQDRLISELEAQNAELERFAYTISHDLKTPLVTIFGFLGYLKRDLAKGDTRALEGDLDKIREAATRMSQLLDELLELTRIGRIEVQPTLISFAELVDEALILVEAQLRSRSVKLSIDPGLPVVTYDRTRLREVLVILLDNAIKFMGDQPQAEIQIGCRESGSDRVFFVRDNGIGIDVEYHEQIFGLFDRLENDVPGTGIGLAIARRIFDTNGGRIWVESNGEGAGSTFCFTTSLSNDHQSLHVGPAAPMLAPEPR